MLIKCCMANYGLLMTMSPTHHSVSFELTMLRPIKARLTQSDCP